MALLAIRLLASGTAALCLVTLSSASCTYDFSDHGGSGGQATATSADAASSSVDGSATASSVGGGGLTGAGGGGGQSECVVGDPAACNDANVCTTDVCSGGQCVNSPVADGLAPGYVDNPTDCVDDVCAHGMLLKGTADDSEIPDDMNVCTTDTCHGGLANFAPNQALDNTSCGRNNQKCSDGMCVGCITASDCAGVDTFCQIRTCDAAHVCGTQNVNDGMALPTGQTAQDCKSINCEGGIATSQNADDPVIDNNECATHTCVNGVDVQQNLGATTKCGNPAHCTTSTHFKPQNHCGGGMCLTVTGYECPLPYSCTMNKCNTNCGNDNMCAPGHTCDVPSQTCQ